MKRIDQPTQQPTPTRYPTEALSPAAQQAVARLELRLNHPTTRQTPARPQHTPTRARCTGDCTTTTQLPAPDWTRDRWGWLCPTHAHARTDRPAVTSA